MVASSSSSSIAGGSLATDAAVRTSPSSGESTGKSDDTTIATVSETGMQVWGMSKESGGVKPPVTCLLNLIWVAENQPGIACIGYVKDVRVRLMGPWLRGSNGEFNLPSMGEFEFTFMHHPGHGNNWGAPTVNTSQMFADTYIAEKHAYAHDVRDRLFNTRNLVQQLNTQGFESYQAPAGTGQPADAGYEPAPDINQDYMPGPYGNDVEPAVPVEAPRLGVPNSLKYGDPPNLPETSTVVMPVDVA